MTDERFIPFSLQHGLIALGGFIAIAICVVAGRRRGTPERVARALLTFITLGSYAVSQWAWSQVPSEVSLDNLVPFHLCDIASFIAGFALITRRRTLILLTYFWGLAGTLQGIATPALDFAPPHPVAIAFFLQHFSVIAAAVYFPAAEGWRLAEPWWHEPLKAFAWLNVYVVFAVLANGLLGTNFGFLAAKPTTPSLLDHLGPHPYYIIWLEIIALVLFALLSLPVRKGHRGSP
ncbi:TIGR02206 family membrane protein [Haloferula luteola]|uniref:TMEM164-related integral membrane acyltransferase n=1 Tax=Haloferula luteola TaxID=595692 RepID=UPI00161421AB